MHFNCKDRDRLKVNGWKRTYPMKTVSIRRLQWMYSYQIAFESKGIIRDEERHFIIKRGLIYQEDMTFINVYVPDNRISK